MAANIIRDSHIGTTFFLSKKRCPRPDFADPRTWYAIGTGGINKLPDHTQKHSKISVHFP